MLCPDQTTVSLIEFCAVNMLLLRSSIESAVDDEGWDMNRFLDCFQNTATRRIYTSQSTHTSAIAGNDQSIHERRVQRALLIAVGGGNIYPR